MQIERLEANKKPGLGIRVLNSIEAGGNKLPHPVTLFLFFSVIVVLLSYVLSFFNIEAIHPGT